jgi:hypothetical protein
LSIGDQYFHMDYDILGGLERALDQGNGSSEYNIGCLLSSELERAAQRAHQNNRTPYNDAHQSGHKRKPEWEPEWQAWGSGLGGVGMASSCHQLNPKDERDALHSLRR